MSHGSWLPHIHKRKRAYSAHRKLHPYPHPNPWVRRLDYLVFVVGVLGPIANIPQIMKIYSERNAAGLSFLAWSLFLVFNIPWLLYGIVHKAKPIILAHTLWFSTELIVLIGIVMYSA
jgi:uncharacterized protein with PQ loop repeat